MPDFEIETYKVSSYLQRFTGETRRDRVLQMTIRTRAISEMMAARIPAIRSPLVPMPTLEDLPDQGGQD